MRVTCGLILALLLAACGDDDNSTCVPSDTVSCGDPSDGGMDANPDAAPDAGPIDCNPVGDGDDCFLPFPSDVFLTEDPLTTTGSKVVVPVPARVTWDEGSFDPTALLEPDGFSIASQIVFALAEAAEETQLTNRRDDFSDTLVASSKTLLINADTAEIVAHFAEVDARDNTSNPLNFIRPASPLEFETRYIVAVQGVENQSGTTIEASDGFRELRDSAPGADPALQRHYDDDIFSVLDQIGVVRGDLQLAWDFTTGSATNVRSSLYKVRDTMATWLLENTPPVTITSVEDHASPGIAKVVVGTIGVPAFVDSTEPGARLLAEPDLENLMEVPFKATIPQRVVDGEIAGRAIQFGHGFFGDYDEIESDFHSSFANDYGFVHFAINWWGMSRPDQATVVTAIMNNMDELPSFAERVHQAMANQLAFTKAIKTSLADAAPFVSADATLYDKDNVYYYGISGGHMLGTVFLALSDDIKRATLSVGGGSWTLIASRSTNFAPFLALIALEVRTSRRVQEITAQLQLALDMIEPVVFSEDLRAKMDAEEPLVLAVHAGVGDAQVPNIATEYQMRSLGIPALAPTAWNYFGQETVEGPQTRAAVTWFDFGTDPLPGDRAESTAENTPAHGQTRQTTASQEQIDRLFRPDGQIEQTCEGVCDPE